jgi:hypothetical protein
MDRWIDDIRLTWASLRSSADTSGWRGTPLAAFGACDVRSALHFPGGEEALLVGFSGQSTPPVNLLPQGVGFAVERVDQEDDVKAWLALTRNIHASLELFETMVEDIVSALADARTTDETRLMNVFLGRIRAWQEFMRKGNQGLGQEAEVGLVGELVVLAEILSVGVPPQVALAGWVGPLDGPQDFHLGAGALEVKATVSLSGFLARFGSLQQLDDSHRSPIHVAAVRLRVAESGRNLSAYVDATRRVVEGHPEAQGLLEERLIAAGYRDVHKVRYSRRFLLAESWTIEVGAEFPRLIAGTVPPGVVWATYEVNLDAAPGARGDVATALKSMGAM